MHEHNVILNKIDPGLLQPPHMFHDVMQLVVDAQHLDSSQLAHLTTHLAECSLCRTTLIAWLSAESAYEQTFAPSEAGAHELLMQFAALHQELQARENEQLCAYAEAIAEVGKQEAAKRYPQLAHHVCCCRSCRAAVEDILAFINEAE